MWLRERQISSMRFYYARPLWGEGERGKKKEKNEMKKSDMGAVRGIIAFLTKE